MTVGELPGESIIWIKNTTSENIKCHGLDVGVINTSEPNNWCRVPKNNAINAGFPQQYTYLDKLPPAMAVYLWKRTA